jgi:hypothetical protein
MRKINKKATSLMYQIIVHLVLIGLIFGMFFLAATYRSNSRAVKQQVLEKQTALLIDSSVPETTITIKKISVNGVITNMEIKEGRVFAYINSQGFSKGYPYFSGYNVLLTSDNSNYIIKITK